MTNRPHGPARRSSSPEVRPLTKAAIPEVGAVLTDAFWEYEEVTHLLPHEARRKRVLPRYLTADCIDALRFGTLFGAFGGDGLVGAAAWLPPGAYPESASRRVTSLLHLAPMVPRCLPVVPEVLRSWSAKSAGHTEEPHVYLCVLGVSRRLQSSGAGSALMEVMLDQADSDGVGCYLTTATESNTSWYGRFGFEVTEEFQPTPRWPTVWRMWRHAPVR